MRSAAPLLFLLLSSLGGLAVASAADDGTRPKVTDNAMTARLDALERNLSALQKYAYNSAVVGGEKGGSSSSQSIANLNADEITEQFKSLRSEIEKLQYSDARLKEKTSQIVADLDYRITQLEKNKSAGRDASIDGALDAVDDYLEDRQESDSASGAYSGSDTANSANGGANSSDSKLAKAKSPEEQYQDAYTLLRAVPVGGSYIKAVKAFDKFITQNPKHALVGNAYYWMAEAYANNGDYDTAAVQYLNGYKANPSGGRAPDNLLGLGKALLKLNKRQEACSTLGKLKVSFPNASNTVKRNAAQVMKQAGCS